MVDPTSTLFSKIPATTASSHQEWLEAHAKYGWKTELLWSNTHKQSHIYKTSDGHTARSVSLRPRSISIIPVLSRDQKLFTMLVSEFRTGPGCDIWQFPSERLNEGEETFDGAMRALEEETSIEPEWIHGFEEIDIGSTNYLCPRMTNEQGMYVRIDIDLPLHIAFSSISQQLTGNHDGGEYLTTHLVRMRPGLYRELHTIGDKLALREVIDQLRLENRF